MTPKSTAIAALVLGLAPLVFAARARSAEPLADSTGDCAVVTASVRYSAGYTHVVTLMNHCPRAVSCEVWTNVDPSPRQTLRAKSGESASVVTRIGSPSRDVTAGKSCRYE